MKKIRLFRFNLLFEFGILLGIVSSAISLIIPLIVKNIIDIRGIVHNKVSLPSIVGIVTFLIVSMLITAMSNFMLSKSGDQQIKSIRVNIQEHLLSLPLMFFNDNLSGQLTSRVINDALVVKDFITTTVPTVINSLIMTIGTIVILFMLDWKLTLFVLICFPLDAMITIPLGKITEKLSISSQDRLSKLNGVTSESLSEIRAVKLNTAEKSMLEKFKKYANDLYRISIKEDGVFAIASPLQSFFSLILILALIMYGGFRVTSSSLSLGTLVSFLIYFYQLVGPINSIAVFYSDYKQAKGATSKINDIMNTPKEYTSTYDIKKRIHSNDDLMLRNINFSYGQNIILQDINMTFERGKKIAIVGPSGAGKTTVVNLLTRIYSPTNGTISLGNINSEKYDLFSWRDQFGVVTQENTIFAGTIYDNLIFGLSSKPSAEEIKEALRKSNLLSEIKKLPFGVNTILGEHGVKLSGGQRQRLQIARAFLKKLPF